MSATAEFIVVTGPDQSHLHPCMDLCVELTRRGHLATLVIPSHLSSAIPSWFASNPLVAVAQIASSPSPPMRVSDPLSLPAGQDLSAHLGKRRAAGGGEPPRVVCAVVDFQVGWTKEVFSKFDVPVIGFFTFGEARLIPGLPEEIVYSDLIRKPFGPPRGGPPGHGLGGGRPPKSGDWPPWVPEVEGSIGLMVNTRADLEPPFLDYMWYQMQTPFLGVGPLLPEQHWKTSDSLISGRRGPPGTFPAGKPNWKPYGEYLPPGQDKKVTKWGPLLPEQYWKTSDSLISGRQGLPGTFLAGKPNWEPYGEYLAPGQDKKIREWGLMSGLAPELPKHPLMGKSWSNCGWSSTAQAGGRRFSHATWPIGVGRYYNSKSKEHHVKTGHGVSNDTSEKVRDNAGEGIGKTFGLGAMASFQFYVKYHFQIGRFRFEGSISRLAKKMH